MTTFSDPQGVCFANAHIPEIKKTFTPYRALQVFVFVCAPGMPRAAIVATLVTTKEVRRASCGNS